MIVSLLAFTMALSGNDFTCPMLGSKANPNLYVDYDGLRMYVCCGGCFASMQKDPAKLYAEGVEKKATFSESLFDPISHNRIQADKAEASSDYKGVRYYFKSNDEKAKFDASPKTFAVVPKKESLVCAVSKEKIGSYAEAGGYADYKGVRYYFCCGDCPTEFAKDPAKYAAAVKDKVAAPAIHNEPKK